jgi:hypothetical protein
VLALDPASTVDIQITNGGTVDLNQCGVAVNGDGPCALTVTGATLTAKAVSVSGSTCLTNGGTISSTNGVKTQQPAVADPYSGTPAPALGGCTPYNQNATQTLSHGTYCGFTLYSGTTTLNPGVYVIDGGYFTVSNATLTGTGVTIILTGTGSNYAALSFSNAATVNLTAPTTGTYAGIAIFQVPAAPVKTIATTANSIVGGTHVTLTGVLYFPSQALLYSNGATTSSTCTQVVAWQLSWQGGATLNSNCAGTGVSTIGTSPSQLVE